MSRPEVITVTLVLGASLRSWRDYCNAQDTFSTSEPLREVRGETAGENTLGFQFELLPSLSEEKALGFSIKLFPIFSERKPLIFQFDLFLSSSGSIAKKIQFLFDTLQCSLSNPDSCAG